ncbi:nucleic acid-binding, OB-fold protein [Tanacetum coccineum]
MILDDAEIPAIKALRDADSGVELKNPYVPIDLTRPVQGTIENLLMWSRNRKNNVPSFLSSLVWTKTGWNFPSCGSEDCRKSVTRQKGYFYCESCNKRVDIPMLRYRLELDVSDDTAQTVVVMFDETTTALVGCLAGSLMDIEDESADDHVSLPPAILNVIGTTQVMEIKSHSYYEYGTFENFTCWQLNPEEEAWSLRTLMLKQLVTRFGYAGKNNVDPLSDNNKRKRKLIEDSTGDVSGGTPKGGNTDWRGSQSDKKKGVVCRMLRCKLRHPYRSALAGGRVRLADLGKNVLHNANYVFCFVSIIQIRLCLADGEPSIIN